MSKSVPGEQAGPKLPEKKPQGLWKVREEVRR